MATTNWKPDTHNIEFTNMDGVISFESSDPKYVGRDPEEVHAEVFAEHIAINSGQL